MRNFFTKIFFPFRGLNFFILAFAILAVTSCKEEEKRLDEVRLNVKVIDDLGAYINNADIYVFDDKTLYQNAISSGVYTTAFNHTLSVASGVTILVPSNKELYVYIKYTDTGRNFILSNVGDGRIDKLENQSDINAKIFIAPISGNLSFWSQNINKKDFNVTINGVVQPPLTTFMAAAPTIPNDVNALNVMMIAGTYTYSAVADNGCVWVGSVTVQRGGFQTIELSPCVRGRVNFFTSTYDPLHGPITVVLDNNDVIGKINGNGSYTCSGNGSAATGSLSSGSFLTVTRDVNLVNPYTYTATSADGHCIWTGSFNINSDTCISIPLGTCF